MMAKYLDLLQTIKNHKYGLSQCIVHNNTCPSDWQNAAINGLQKFTDTYATLMETV